MSILALSTASGLPDTESTELPLAPLSMFTRADERAVISLIVAPALPIIFPQIICGISTSICKRAADNDEDRASKKWRRNLDRPGGSEAASKEEGTRLEHPGRRRRPLAAGALGRSAPRGCRRDGGKAQRLHEVECKQTASSEERSRAVSPPMTLLSAPAVYAHVITTKFVSWCGARLTLQPEPH